MVTRQINYFLSEQITFSDDPRRSQQHLKSRLYKSIRPWKSNIRERTNFRNLHHSETYARQGLVDQTCSGKSIHPALVRIRSSSLLVCNTARAQGKTKILAAASVVLTPSQFFTVQSHEMGIKRFHFRSRGFGETSRKPVCIQAQTDVTTSKSLHCAISVFLLSWFKIQIHPVLQLASNFKI
ncbi:hypothetical protein BGZ60DRAFT_396742 [Tricladium varicosporioides]|nr:hypothetical protein BGZ60DRAFT_396742 [Hymenoscyphus varicosporioides]